VLTEAAPTRIAKKIPEITPIATTYASTPRISGPTFCVNLVQP
jgi:hypothetical protein